MNLQFFRILASVDPFWGGQSGRGSRPSCCRWDGWVLIVGRPQWWHGNPVRCHGWAGHRADAWFKGSKLGLGNGSEVQNRSLSEVSVHCEYLHICRLSTAMDIDIDGHLYIYIFTLVYIHNMNTRCCIHNYINLLCTTFCEGSYGFEGGFLRLYCEWLILAVSCTHTVNLLFALCTCRLRCSLQWFNQSVHTPFFL